MRFQFHPLLTFWGRILFTFVALWFLATKLNWQEFLTT